MVMTSLFSPAGLTVNELVVAAVTRAVGGVRGGDGVGWPRR